MGLCCGRFAFKVNSILLFLLLLVFLLLQRACTFLKERSPVLRHSCQIRRFGDFSKCKVSEWGLGFFYDFLGSNLTLSAYFISWVTLPKVEINITK